MIKRYGWASALLSGLLLVALNPAPTLAVDANTCGYTQGPGGWYKSTDRSGPYALDGNCNATLLGSGGGGGTGGGGTSGTVTQGPAAADNATNRWPVVAYQGGTWSFGLSGPIPTGTNVIGAVTQSGGPWTISGAVTATLNQGGNALSTGNPIFAQITNLPSTQPVSGTVNVGNFPATQNVAGTVAQGAAGTAAWKVDGSGVTQPVSGTVSVGNFPATQSVSAASLPLPTGAATAANQNSTAAGTSANNAQGVQGVTGGVPLPVSGSVAVTQGTSPWSISGPVTQSGTWTVAQGTPGANAWKVDGSGVTQPVSAATLPLPNGAATAASQTNVQSAAGTSAGTLLSVQGSTSGVPIPVSGTVNIGNQPSSQAVTNAGTFAVQNTAPVVGGNSAAVKVDGSAVTQPVSAASLPLPTGAATAANQALQTAALQGPTPSGTNVIGRVGVDQTTPGTTNGVYVLNGSISFFEYSNTTSASQSITGPTRDSGAPPTVYTRFASFVNTTQAGTAFIQGSPDGNNWFTITSVSMAANTPVTLTNPLVMRYMRSLFVNGATAGNATITTAFLAN